MKNISLLGAGGMSSEVISLLTKSYMYEIDYLYDSTISKDINKNGYTISNKFRKDNFHIVGVGYPTIKQAILNSIGMIKLAPAYIHSLSIIGQNVSIGIGSVIYPMTVFTGNIDIGPLASINSTVTIGHDCKIGTMFHASAGAVVSGNVKIGHRVFLGANSTIKENISICDDVTIGAGAVIIKNITEPGVYAGCPIRSI